MTRKTEGLAVYQLVWRASEILLHGGTNPQKYPRELPQPGLVLEAGRESRLELAVESLHHPVRLRVIRGGVM